jgi:peptide/nickel transport system substrate-binding protein
MDPVKRVTFIIQMNDLAIKNVAVVPIVARNGANAVAKRLRGTDFSPWSGSLWKIAYWHRDG